MICRDKAGYPTNACNFAMKPVSRQPCIGVGHDCETDETQRQKKGAAASGETSEDQNPSGQGLATNGWMKLDSGILKVPPPPKVQTTERPLSTVQDDFEPSLMEDDTANNENVAKGPTTEAAVIPSEPT